MSVGSKMEHLRTERTGHADLPLHGGKAPRWLFDRMAKLTRHILEVMLAELSQEEILARFADPHWFQALGCVLGFDWHSSGLTTTVCGALKEASSILGHETGLHVAGGKGRVSRKTPDEIKAVCDGIGLDAGGLVYASGISAKVDSSCVQDGFTIYHHTFIFTSKGKWCVIQQGMNPSLGMARRYHWLGERVESFVNEPHSAICCDVTCPTLNLVASQSREVRQISQNLCLESPEKAYGLMLKIASTEPNLIMPKRHEVRLGDINPARLKPILLKIYDHQPQSYEDLLGIKGVGAKTLRALALVSELVYGKAPSYKDPARFAFAHGGKDGHPYPVDRRTYDRTIEIVKRAIASAKIGERAKLGALRRLASTFGID